MSRRQQLIFRIRAAWLHHEIEALKRRHARAQRRLENRPYVPSAFLVSGHMVADEPLQDSPGTILWARAAALVLAFAAGILIAGIAHPTAPVETPNAEHQVCSTKYETPEQ